MNSSEHETELVNDQERDGADQTVDNRSAMIGLLALLSLAFPALLIRNLFPDLNPLFLAGLGVITYGIYLTWLLFRQSEQAREMESSLEPAKVKAQDKRLIARNREKHYE